MWPSSDGHRIGAEIEAGELYEPRALDKHVYVYHHGMCLNIDTLSLPSKSYMTSSSIAFVACLRVSELKNFCPTSSVVL